MRAVTFTITLLEPLLATGLEGEPNRAVSFNYVPGSLIRGACISRYSRQQSKSQLDLSDDAERALFFDGRVRYLNAYPLVLIDDKGQTSRALPTPLSWHILKDADEPESQSMTEIHDLRFQSAQQAFADQPSKLLVNAKPFFCYIGNDVVTVKPERRIAVHTQREPRRGHATEDEGAVFRYDSVAAGTCFGGVIIFSAQADATLENNIAKLLTTREMHLGGSRTGGYGRAQVAEVKSFHHWQETTVNPPLAISKDEEFTLTLLSNALVRNKYGQYQADLSIEELQKHLGAIVPLASGAHKRAEVVGGFNRKWGLPLPQTISLQAGSVFAFKAGADIAQQQLQKLIDDGIGERRVEGFGRFAINLHTADTLDWRPPEREQLGAAPTLPAATETLEHRLAKHIAERILRQRLEAKLIAMVNLYTIEHAPPNSQIARLRATLREALRSASRHPVTEFFE